MNLFHKLISQVLRLAPGPGPYRCRGVKPKEFMKADYSVTLRSYSINLKVLKECPPQ